MLPTRRTQPYRRGVGREASPVLAAILRGTSPLTSQITSSFGTGGGRPVQPSPGAGGGTPASPYSPVPVSSSFGVEGGRAVDDAVRQVLVAKRRELKLADLISTATAIQQEHQKVLQARQRPRAHI